METLTERLAQEQAVVLDGGLATSLAAAGHRMGDALWSARLLLDDPTAVIEAHAAFVQHGAEIVTTVSYQLAARSLDATGRDPADAARLLQRSVELAREAVAATPSPSARPVSVAASIGPYGAVLADGSEYRGGYGLSVTELTDFHAPRVAALVDARPDALACETIPSGTEIEALAGLVAGRGIPTWISVSVGADGATTAEGQPLLEALAPALQVDEVIAVGVNCCAPTAVPAALDVLRGCGRALIVYPNLGDRWDTQTSAWVRDGGGPEGFDPAGWVAAGARIVGGCCGTSPTDIARIARHVSLVRARSRPSGERGG